MTTPDFLPYLAQTQLGNAPECPGKEKDMGIDMGPHKGQVPDSAIINKRRYVRAGNFTAKIKEDRWIADLPGRPFLHPRISSLPSQECGGGNYERV